MFHISAATTDRGYKIASWIEGDRVEEVLQYVQYDQHTLVESIRQKLEDALEQSQLNVSDARRMMKTYRRGLRGYTYLNTSDSQKIEQNEPKTRFKRNRIINHNPKDMSHCKPYPTNPYVNASFPSRDHTFDVTNPYTKEKLFSFHFVMRMLLKMR